VSPSNSGRREPQLGLTLQEATQQATACYQRGDWREAERLCRLILSRHPEEVGAMNLLGVIALRSGHTTEGAELLRRVVLAQPRNPAAHVNFGNALLQLERHDSALQSFATALAIKPDYAEAYNNRGVALRALRRLDEALDSYDRALQFCPSDRADVHNNRGLVLRALNRPTEALDSFERALAIKRDYAEAHNNRGVALRELARHDEALISLQRALQLKPDYVEAHSNLGNVLVDLGRLGEALQSHERVVQLRPHYAQAHSNRGLVLKDLGRYQEAQESYERALQIDPACAEAHNNIGVLHQERNEPERAVHSYDRALAIRPDLAVAHENRAYARLLAGDFAPGWADLEWRWRNRPDAREVLRSNQPLWLGAESLRGRKILLLSEQGLGDTLQFCRYAGPVAALGAEVVLEVPGPLARLLSSLEGVSRLVVRGDPLPQHDYHCPLMSLPLAFGTTLASIPAGVPYLQADPEQVRAWGERLGIATKLRVGLVWSGGFRKRQPQLWPTNRRRNIPLTRLAPLRHPDIEFYSLQQGEPAESELAELMARKWAGPALMNHTQLLGDFADTAALIDNLDLVITVDTAMAHLAGALGKRVWIMNRFDTCWRWLLHRSDSPWYPTATLYRQERAGDWEGVVARISADLRRLVRTLQIGRAPPM